ncbi:MAG TPA: glutamine synthetase III [Candidatus Desulfovibrio gallistercoris]|uniref:glutamine synthetase III family protein n=1 Tax=uncultured Desulfovibrio sp. TaxID=167968 RepID=UPI001F993BDF|nr:glutamine synthetase III [uncultured Desulfovibrio sp.]HJA77163.1 glutamine synthetase III [Candidatus Desulfovibrio gallistercoris]
MSNSARQNAIQAITSYKDEANIDYAKNRPVDFYGCNVFDDKAMRARLPKDVYKSLHKAITLGERMDPSIADTVAAVMKDWAIEKGATHFAHIFYPLTGQTAEKHDSFLMPDGYGGVIAEFSGNMLIRGEPDASSFPSGGLRSTFEARGYTAWDVTSPAYIMENPNGTFLCIPTMFLSWTGVALDKKTPLLRSGQALNRAARRVLKIFGIEPELPIVSFAGLEQEYFCIDHNYNFARPDLQVAGRSLFGARPAKGQEFSDQYFGVIPQRVLSYMMEVEYELYKLGVPVRTRHNEAAPSQYEIAPLYEVSNLAVDHNHIIMSTLRNVAKRYGLKCLLHEKPFHGVNGSGKHVNYSIGNRELGSLFDPGATPHANAKFLVFCSAMIRAVHKYGGLLRATVASASNDHRLGAHEAPPAIMSIFLGDQLTEVFEAFRAGRVENAANGKPARMMNVGVDTLPPLPTDPGDRNRTSPVAFTGNRFEFRALGSSQSAAGSITALNAMMSDSLNHAADYLEKEIAAGKDLNAAIQSYVEHVIEEHSAIIFNGDGYSEIWHKEAVRRGLPNLRNTPEALPELIRPEVVALYESNGILNRAELKARHDIYLEQYCKTLRTEATLVIRMARTIIFPAGMRYQGELAETAARMKAVGMDIRVDMLRDVTEQLRGMQDAVVRLETALGGVDGQSDLLTRARQYCEEVLPLMDEVRRYADLLETRVADDLWDLPSYQEILFGK